MGRRIFSCSISLLLLCGLLMAVATPLPAQNYRQGGQDTRPVAKKQEKKKPEIEYPLFNGVSVGVDLWGVGSKLFGGDFMSSEVIVDVDLKHRFFPVVELGYGGVDAWNDNGIHYKSSAPYFRVGMDYNALYKKKHGQMILVGLRYGHSSFDYHIASLMLDDPVYGGQPWNPNLTDDIWGESVPYDHAGLKGSMHWAEFCVGIRANIWKSIYMGLGMRYRMNLSETKSALGDPWYVPGFGKYGKNTLGVQYSLIYKLPF